jgi:tetrahydromethanopterin S-methyltransferase subunit C
MGVKNNISSALTQVRIVVGLAVGLIGLGVLSNRLPFGIAVGRALAAVALIVTGSGFVRVCPSYRLLGIATSQFKY